MAVRKVIHFIVLEAVLLTAANVMEMVSGVLYNVLFFFEIFFIYIVVMFVNWINDKRIADAINAKLLDLKNEENEDE